MISILFESPDGELQLQSEDPVMKELFRVEQFLSKPLPYGDSHGVRFYPGDRVFGWNLHPQEGSIGVIKKICKRADMRGVEFEVQCSWPEADGGVGSCLLTFTQVRKV